MPVKEIPFPLYYGKERFAQFNPMDAANFYVVQSKDGKKGAAMYPAMGRRHINVLGKNKLDFATEPRALFRSINFGYAVVNDQIYQINSSYNQKLISNASFSKTTGDIWFAYLPTPNTVYAVFTDGTDIFIYDENANTFQRVTDPQKPTNPTYIAAFGNRIAVSSRDSTQFQVSRINLLDGSTVNNLFTFGASGTLFAQEQGIIKQMATLHNQLFIFTDFNCGIWSNQSTDLSEGGTVIPFPFRKNTAYNFDYGMADPKTLDVDFGSMVWLGQSRNGLVDVVVSDGGAPKPLSTKAVDVLLENQIVTNDVSPFLKGNANGFLYQYENTTFYRLSAAEFLDIGVSDVEGSANCIEYNFDIGEWHRCIELNGERNLVQKHIYLNNRHLVTVKDDTTIYEMSGRFYVNERRTPETNINNSNAYTIEPMRYVAVTPIIAMPDYSEFQTDWVQFDMIFGEALGTYYDTAFANAEFVVAEDEDADGCPIYLVTEDGDFIVTEDSNYPTATSTVYYAHFQPHIELLYSDDGGQRFHTCGQKRFSDIGTFRWRMRWYQLGTSRNRVYKLICVSPSPIVILGAIQNVKPISGGAR